MSASDYAHLSGVTFDGGQYITLYNLPQDCSVRIVSSVANTDSGIKTVFGYRASSSAASDISIEYQSSTLKNWSRNSGYITPGEQTITSSVKYTAEATLLTARSIMYVGKYGTSNNYQYFKGNLYSFTITDVGGTTIYELIPSRRISDNVVGFYDTVSDVFYENEGSGAFLPVALPPAFDKKMFLAGLAVGRKLKGWGVVDNLGVRNVSDGNVAPACTQPGQFNGLLVPAGTRYTFIRAANQYFYFVAVNTVSFTAVEYCNGEPESSHPASTYVYRGKTVWCAVGDWYSPIPTPYVPYNDAIVDADSGTPPNNVILTQGLMILLE